MENHKKERPIAVKILLLVVLAMLMCCNCSGNEGGDGQPGGHAPDFSLKDIQGKTIRLKDLRGKVVLVNFFATWCAPCRQEIPDFLKLYDRYKEKGFEIVGIGVDMEGEAALRPFAEHFRLPYPVAVGTREVVLDYGGITGVPTSFLIDRQGNIVDQFIGVRPLRILEKNVTDLLSKKA